MNDSDQGSCANTPMPADCSGTTDTAWKYTYDPDGNQLSVTDPRNQSPYLSYDALDRPLCLATSSADASSCGGSTYGAYFYDGYSNASTPGATFPSGCSAPTGSYASDPIGHETAETFTGASGAGSGWRCYGYDGRGRTDQNTLSVTTPDGYTVTQTINLSYDDQQDVTSLVYPDGEVLTSNYDSNGRFQSAYFGTPRRPTRSSSWWARPATPTTACSRAWRWADLVPRTARPPRSSASRRAMTASSGPAAPA